MTEQSSYQTVQKAVRTKIFTAPTDCWVSIIRSLGSATSQYASDSMLIYVNDETVHPALRIWSANGQWVQSAYIRLKAGDELYALHSYTVETKVYATYTSI